MQVTQQEEKNGSEPKAIIINYNDIKSIRDGLEKAAREGNIATVKECMKNPLVHSTVASFAVVTWGMTLRHAAESGSFEIVKLLIESDNQHIKPYIQYYDIGDAFIKSVIKGHPTIISFFLPDDGKKTIIDNRHLITALNRAADAGNIEVAVKIAEKLGSNIIDPDFLYHSITELPKHPSKESNKLVIKLIDENTDKDHKEEQTCNAIVAASRVNNIELAKTLMKREISQKLWEGKILLPLYGYQLNEAHKMILKDQRSSAWWDDNGIQLSEDDAKQAEANNSTATLTSNQDAKQPTTKLSTTTAVSTTLSIKEEKFRG
jgi:hypothetical protein